MIMTSFIWHNICVLMHFPVLLALPSTSWSVQSVCLLKIIIRAPFTLRAFSPGALKVLSTNGLYKNLLETGDSHLGFKSSGIRFKHFCLFLTFLMSSESESEVAQSCPTLCDCVDCSPPGSSVHGILQARVLERDPEKCGSSTLQETTLSRKPLVTLATKLTNF